MDAAGVRTVPVEVAPRGDGHGPEPDGGYRDGRVSVLPRVLVSIHVSIHVSTRRRRRREPDRGQRDGDVLIREGERAGGASREFAVLPAIRGKDEIVNLIRQIRGELSRGEGLGASLRRRLGLEPGKLRAGRLRASSPPPARTPPFERHGAHGGAPVPSLGGSVATARVDAREGVAAATAAATASVGDSPRASAASLAALPGDGPNVPIATGAGAGVLAIAASCASVGVSPSPNAGRSVGVGRLGSSTVGETIDAGES